MRLNTVTSASPRRRGMRLRLVAALAAAGLALTACAATDSSANSGDQEVTEEIMAAAMARTEPWVVTSSGPGVVVDGKSLDFTIVKIASVRAAEQMKALGWNVEARFIEANENVIQSGLQNESDAINISLASVLPAAAGGVPLHVFAGGSRFGFLVVGDSSIESIDDLEGKRIAYQAPISAGTLAVRLWTLGSDVQPQYLTMSGSAARAEALLAGQLDAVAVSTGFDAVIQEQGGVDNYGVLYDPLDEYPWLLDTVLAYVGELDLEKRAFLQVFLAEQIKAVEELKANPAVLEEWMTEHEVSVSSPVEILTALLFDDIGVSVETIDEQVALMIETEQIEGDSSSIPAGADLIDTSIWDAIKDSL